MVSGPAEPARTTISPHDPTGRGARYRPPRGDPERTRRVPGSTPGVGTRCGLLRGHLPRVDARYKIGVIERAGPALEIEAREFRAFTSEVHASVELGLIVRIGKESFLSASGNFGSSLRRGRICEASKSKQRCGCDAMHSIHTV